MFDRYRSGERAALVHLDLSGRRDRGDLDEFLELVASAGAQQISLITGARGAPEPRYFVGRGKVEEIRQQVADTKVDLLIFNHELTPSQERNIERFCKCRVVGRSGLILDIFAQRARSHEGKLQVELAQLKYLSTRLIRGWTHLERQKGGIGLRGPGETQLESDRRLLGSRIKQINKRLQKVRRQRQQSRQARRKASVPSVSLVGYTNAGKSTLFNQFTGASVFCADKLFATLDPTLRQYRLADNQRVVLADTVGFIQQLPHDLVAAFRATLQETREADLLLHIVDASDDRRHDHLRQVNQILEDIGAARAPQIVVFNKIDLLKSEPRVEFESGLGVTQVWVSARTGEGLDLLSQAMAQALECDTMHEWLTLPPQAGRVRASLFELGAVIQEQMNELGGWQLEIKMPRREFEAISRREGFPEYLLSI